MGGKWEIAFSGGRQDSAQKETLAVSVVVKEHNHPLLLPKCRRRLTEESLIKVTVPEESVLPD